MDINLLKKLEYEEQCFKFNSEYFVDCFTKLLKNETEQTLSHLTNNINKKLEQETTNPKAFQEHLKAMNETLQNEYMKAIETAMKNNADKIKSYFNVPDYVLMKEDLPVRTGLALNEQDLDLDLEIKRLQQVLTNRLYMKKKIEQEMQWAEQVIYVMKDVCSREIPKIECHPINQEELLNEFTKLLN